MRELQLRLYDDLCAVTGMRVEAQAVRRLVLDGREVELDLTEEHAGELDELLAPYFEAGQKPEQVTAPAAGTAAARREYNEQMRRFADRHEGYGQFETYKPLPKGGFYYPRTLREAFAAHMAAEATR